jgi:hypothetical protein
MDIVARLCKTTQRARSGNDEQRSPPVLALLRQRSAAIAAREDGGC